MLTKRQLEVLKQMAEAYGDGDYENAEIVAEGIHVYLGERRLSWGTLRAFLDCVVVSSDAFEKGGFARYEINATGLAVVRRPELADEVWLRLRTGKPFTIKNDRIEDM